MKKLTESTEVLGNVLRVVLAHKAVLGPDVVADRVLLADGLGRAVSEGAGVQIFTYEPFHVAGVAGDELFSDFVVGTADPIFRKTTAISKNSFVFI